MKCDVMDLSVFKSVMVPPFSWCFSSRTDESYAVVSEYYGRGLFNKVTVITESAQASPPAIASATASVPAPAPVPAPVVQTYGPGAEAKLRLQEGQSKQVFVSNTVKNIPPRGTSVVPIPEGRMRVMEQNLYSSSLEANITRLEPVHAKTYTSPMPTRRIDKPISAEVSPKISSAITNGAQTKNPFDDDHYDDSKNPFADEEGHDPTNPFNEDDDYDKNLNPFS